MSRLVIDWPDAGAERVRAARGRLEVAGEALRSASLPDRLRRVAAALEDWTRPDSPWRRELSVAFAAASDFDEGTVSEGLESALRAWQPASLVACAQRELAAVLESSKLGLAPYACTSVLAGGSIPMPTLLSALLPLILGSPVLLRTSSKDHVTAALLQRALAERDEVLARALEVVSFPSDDEGALAAWLDSPCVVATGSDETISALTTRSRVGTRFVAYGHRFSIGVIGPQLASDPIALEEAVGGFALDIARWDQLGCLSPVVLYLVDVPRVQAESFAAALAERLELTAGAMPRGVVPAEIRALQAAERAEARMRSGKAGALLFEGRDSTVILEADPRSRPAPLYRFVRLLPVDSVESLHGALSTFVPHLSTAAVAGFSPADDACLRDMLAGLGLSRVTQPGRLQTPPVDWPHDGMPLLVPMARFVRRE